MSEQNRTTTIEPPEIGTWRGPQALRALRHRDYALFWGGLTVSATGSWMQNVAQSWLVYDLTGSALYLGVVTAAGTLPMLFFTLPAGVLADRCSKRKITIITQTLLMLQAAALTVLTYAHIVQPWHIVALAIFAGIANAVDVPARQSMTVEIVGREDLLNAVALNSTAFNGARVIGPSVGGLIYGAGGPQLCFLVNTISFLAVIAGLSFVRPTPCRLEPNGDSVWKQICQGLGHVRENRLVRDILILTGTASIFGLQYMTLMPAFARDILHVGPAGYGALQAAAGLGALSAAVSIAALGHRFRRGRAVVFGSLVAPAGMIAFTTSPTLALAVVWLVVTGFGMMLFLAVSNNLVQTAVPDELRGRIIGLRSLVFMGFAPFGALQIGWVAQVAGPRTSLVASAFVTLCAAIFFGLRSKAMRGAK